MRFYVFCVIFSETPGGKAHMDSFWNVLASAIGLVFAFDPDLMEIVGLSMQVTMSAVAIACLIGFPLGAIAGAFRFPGRTLLSIILNALMGLPPVVVGLLVYLMLSASGPLGPLGLLYTPTAMIIAQNGSGDPNRCGIDQAGGGGPLPGIWRAVYFARRRTIRPRHGTALGCPLQPAHRRVSRVWPCSR
jgi:ABC-type dipeptide/oligopeptide/nickel transport system permease component